MCVLPAGSCDQRTPTRAERLRQVKTLKRDSLLRRLKNNNDTSSSDNDHTPIATGSREVTKETRTLGERVLFPAGSGDESSDEGNDWIVSDGEEEVDVTAFIDVELMKGVHSAVLLRDTVSLGAASLERVGDCAAGVVERDDSVECMYGSDVVECDEDNLQTQLLKAVTCEEGVHKLSGFLSQARPVINTPLLEGERVAKIASKRDDHLPVKS